MKTGKILVFVNLGYSKLDDSVAQGTFSTQPSSETSAGTASSNNNAWSVDQQSGKVNVNFFGDINLQGNSLINVQKILGMDGKWKIDEIGKLVAQDLEVKGKAKFGTPENPQGITIYDEVTKQPGCVKLVNGSLLVTTGECGITPPPSSETEETTSTTTPQ